MIPEDELAAPVKPLDFARHDVRHQSETLYSGPAGELHQIVSRVRAQKSKAFGMPAPNQANQADRVFVIQAALGSLAEIELARQRCPST